MTTTAPATTTKTTTTATPSAPTWAVIRCQAASELIKIRSSRALWLLPTLALLIGPLTAGVVGLSNSLETTDTVIGGAFTAMTLPIALIGAWGALVMSTEYTSGTIRSVLAATPQRDALFAAKVLVTGGISTLVGALATTLTYLVGVLAIDGSKYAAGEPFPGLLGIVAVFPAVALFGLALGFLLRSSAGAVAAVSAHVVLPEAASATAFGELHKLATIQAPSAVVGKLSQSADAAPELIGALGGWPRLAIVVAVTLSVLALARRALHRRDV
ncbi:ABC transporter permease [Nocardia crassostreae]|uniref:ABC transporter permease n=1 Tax=Nocardia crassostreae TaxID=53428 RepID=UPI000A003B71|nr:ABC transporter permease [Nocardia crassostreae]